MSIYKILILREWTDNGQLWIQQVSSTPATRMDVVNLQVKIIFILAWAFQVFFFFQPVFSLILCMQVIIYCNLFSGITAFFFFLFKF